MKNKKGFTLIELLAVIVILAIIALIAVPQVLKILNKARLSAAEDSTYGIVSSAENYITNFMLKNTGALPNSDIEFTCSSNSCTLTTELTDYNIEDLSTLEYSGTKATSGTVTITSTGDIEVEDLVINGFKCNYPIDGKVDCSSSNNIQQSGITYVEADEDETYLGILYLDPTNLETECNADNSISTTGTKTGCMKWYVYKEEDGVKYAILDHNTTAKVAWNSSGSNTEMKEVAEALVSDTSEWDSSLNARLITANEIAGITGNTSFDSATSTNRIYFNNNAWIYDYTDSCTSYGCNIADSSTNGYWTSSKNISSSSSAWCVSMYNYLDTCDKVYYADHGVRPVITISKSIIS